jgi:signal transduction histidine kinase
MSILVLILAALQFRWVGEVSEAEKERMQARMRSSAARFARDFDRELTRALVYLGPGGPQRRDRGSYAERRARWASSTTLPELVRAVFVASPAEGNELRLFRVEEETGALTPVAWPQDLTALRSRLASLGPVPETGPGPRSSRSLTVTAADVPALVAPFFGPGPAKDAGYTIVWLSEDAIERKLLPELGAKHFSGAAGLEDRLEVSSLGEPPRVIYKAGPSKGEDDSGRFDAEVDLLGVLRADDIESLLSPGVSDAPERPQAGAPDARPPRPPPLPQWRLRVTHPSGSLETAVASIRRRNLAIAFGMLLLLALGMATVLASTRRMQRLARQQLEFTAGVTHELATPLAGMRSAAQNLADGVVSDPARVKEYGLLIEREGRRLTEMVDQVLTFAGMQSRKTSLAKRPLAIGQVIEDALAASQRALDENGFHVEKDIAPDLPAVSGDGPALRRAVENLIGNAVKYAVEGSWIGLRAGVVSGRDGRWLEVRVEDRGPGIAAEDLPRVFEAFYRGRGRYARALPGSGLGLTLVRDITRAHGGRVTVDTTVAQGTAFTILLPVLEEAGP